MTFIKVQLDVDRKIIFRGVEDGQDQLEHA